MIRTIQPNEVVTENLTKALKSMNAELANDPSNAHLLNTYLVKHYTDAQGISDYSEENLREAIWKLKDALTFDIPPKAPRTPNAQSILNESNRERREREAREAQEEADLAKQAEKDEATKEALRQGERMCNLAGTVASVSHARRQVAKERMWAKWESLQRQAPPQVALKLLRAYWESDAGQEELYSVRGTMRRLQNG